MSEQTATATTGIPDWTLGDRMGKSMRAAGVSREEMATYLDVGLSTISTWTGDRIKPNKQTLRLWALRTGVPLEWLEAGQSPHPAGPNGGECAVRDSNPEPADLDAARRRIASRNALAPLVPIAA